MIKYLDGFFFFIEIWCVTLLEFRWFCVCTNCDYLIFWCNWNEFIEKREIEWENEKNLSWWQKWSKSNTRSICQNDQKAYLKLKLLLVEIGDIVYHRLDSMKSEKGINYVFTSRLYKSVDIFVVVIYCLRWSWLSSVSTPARILLNIHISMYRLILFFFWA